MDELVSQLPRYSRQREILERKLNTQSAYAQIDDNGRLVLSIKLREMINLSTEATLIGMGDKFEIWQPQLYHQDMLDLESEFEGYEEGNNPFNLLHSNSPKVD